MRVFYLEDNPLIVFHVEQLVEDLGHSFVGSATSFANLKEEVDPSSIDCALVDIDLADGRTGPEAAKWLSQHGVMSVFVTGQDAVADDNRSLVIGTLNKPISLDELREQLERVKKLKA